MINKIDPMLLNQVKGLLGSGGGWTALNDLGIAGSLSCITVNGSDVYVGGEFQAIGGVAANRIARWNGTSWSALGTGCNGQVKAIAVSGTDVYVGGYFTLAGGVTNTSYIARWNGTSWSALGSGCSGNVFALAVSGTDLYAGGVFILAGGVTVTRIARWNGTSWSALGSGCDSTVNALAVSGTGDLYAGGSFTSAGGVSNTTRIARWNGSAWSSIGNCDATIYSLAVSGTDLYAGGNFTTAGGVSANRIARWNGSAWSALGTGCNNTVSALLVSGTDLYVGGSFTSAGGVTGANYIAKWNGSAWSALSGCDNSVYAVAVAGTDLYVGGTFTAPSYGFAKWGGASWVTPPGEPILATFLTALAVSGTDLYVGGGFTRAGMLSANRIARWNGTSWSALGTGCNSTVSALLVSGTDLYVGGSFTSAGGVANTSRIARWNGTSWSALGTGCNDSVFAVAVSGANVYVGGAFTTAGGVSANRIARWNGSAWSALGSGCSDNNVRALLVSGTDLYAGGDFTSAGGVANTSRIAKWNGTSWSALSSGCGSTVYSLVVLGTDVYAGGSFTTAGGVSANYIAKWNGTAWSALGTGCASNVYAMAVDGTDLYAGGVFSSAGGVANTNRIAQWDGSAWSALGTGCGDNNVNAIAVGNEKVYAGGTFTSAGGALALTLAYYGDSLAPTPGNSGTITTSSVAETGLTLNWTKATDLVTLQANLQYLACYSTSSSFDTVEQVEAGTHVGDYTTDIDTKAVTGLSGGTTYYFNVVVKDEAGNKAVYTKKQQATLDVVAPVVGNSGVITTSNVAATSLTLNWTKATDTVSAQANLQYLVCYSTSSSFDTVEQVEAGTHVGDYTTDINTKEVTGLSDSTTYYFNVVVKDEAGNKAAYAKKSEVTLDSTLPIPGSSGTITTSSVTPTSLTLNWTKATDNVSSQANLQYLACYSTSSSFDTVTQVEAGTHIGVYTADINTKAVTGLSEATTYYFNVVVKDEAGNKAVYAKKLQVTPSTIPTEVTGVIIIEPNSGANIEFSADMTVTATGDVTLNVAEIENLVGGKSIIVQPGGKIKLANGLQVTVIPGTRYELLT